MGDTPVAFVTLRQGVTADEDMLRSLVNQRVGSVQRVAGLRMFPELPNGTMGKIPKRTLRDEHAATLWILP